MISGWWALCASGDSHIVGLLLAWGTMCERRLAHMAGDGVRVAGGVSGIGCFARLLCRGSVGWLVMCSWWLAHLWVWRLSGALCVSGGSRIVGLVLVRAVVCGWWLAHNGATMCLLLHDPWRYPGQQRGNSPDCMPRRCRHELAQ